MHASSCSLCAEDISDTVEDIATRQGSISATRLLSPPQTLNRAALPGPIALALSCGGTSVLAPFFLYLPCFGASMRCGLCCRCCWSCQRRTVNLIPHSACPPAACRTRLSVAASGRAVWVGPQTSKASLAKAALQLPASATAPAPTAVVRGDPTLCRVTLSWSVICCSTKRSLRHLDFTTLTRQAAASSGLLALSKYSAAVSSSRLATYACATARKFPEEISIASSWS
mmetsp:Transcript_28933/g.64241  ORF Transcript_28933/g.64241 Transcript_28933/m.64241 type:complete len:228 (-) Transcript_28933:3523-4206(-)